MEEADVEKKLCLKRIKGVPVFPYFMFDDKTFESAMEYRAKDGDVVLVSYPKTGSTWLLYAIWGILHEGDFQILNDTQTMSAPFVDMLGPQRAEALTEPRFYRHHLPYHLLKRNPKAKYLYIHRSPADTLLSYYNFINQYIKEGVEFDFFFDAFMNGTVGYGDYYDHVLSAYEYRNDDNIFIASYEEMKKDTKAVVLDIAKFLGEKYYETLKADDILLQNVLQQISFETMRKSLTFTIPGEGEPDRKIDFFKKGKVGDGKKRLTETQIRRLNEKTLEKMKGTEFEKTWLL